MDKAAVTRMLAPAGCRKRHVPATLWRGDLLVAVGVNGPRAGDVCTWDSQVGGKDTSCVHAETRCFQSAYGSLWGTELVITRDPCTGLACQEVVERYGVTVTVIPERGPAPAWSSG